jgi:protein AroM
VNRTIGAVTVGQSPRDDVIPAILECLGGGIQVLQCGALDGRNPEEAASGAPGDSEDLLVTRLRGGEEVRVTRGFIVPLLANCVRSLEDRVELILLLCTDPFHELACSKPLLSPGRLFSEMVAELRVGRIGVLVPAEAQICKQQGKWSDLVPEVFVEAASPYGNARHVRTAARSLSRSAVDLVVMDCIGYTVAMKQTVHAAVQRPVLLASETLARAAREVLGKRR